MLRFFLIVALGAGCAPIPGNIDNDRDGYPGESGDCNDLNAAVHPGATELCNGLDDDCDGITDPSDSLNTQPWYADVDQDGAGDAWAVVFACVPPDGYIQDATDCDDADATIQPGATELCDGIDQDCDHQTDEDAIDAPLWHQDADGDGFGGSAQTLTSCTAVDGYVANASDCNDADATIWPGTTEICDGVDQNCNAAIDEDAPDAPRWYNDNDQDGYGDAAVSLSQCVTPIGYVADATDCDDYNNAIWPGATEFCDGLDNNCDSVIDESTASGASDWFMDSDGDGYGQDTLSTRACSRPDGYASVAGDCDDTRATVNPGASEVCNRRDDDCDGYSDLLAIDTITWYLDADNDNFGTTLTSLQACERPELYVDNTDDCDDTRADINPKADEVCDSADNDCDGSADEDSAIDATYWFYDADSDGFGDPSLSQRACAADVSYVADDSDCDDADPNVSPLAGEYCDGIDNDCDTYIDGPRAVDVLTWYADADGDGYGNADRPLLSCEPIDGYVPDGTDCRDQSASVSPIAVEVCDTIDNNCSGDQDDAIDKLSWFLDADGDGAGGATVVMACDQPEGYVGYIVTDTVWGPSPSGVMDCDDTTAAIWPGAAEICDGQDQNCSGDESDALNLSLWFLDSDQDGTGDTLQSQAACEQPDGYVALADDCDDTAPGIYPGAPETCNNGVDDNCNGRSEACRLIDEHADTDASVVFYGAETGWCSVSAGQDLNGDLHQDMLVVIPEQDEARLVMGPIFSAALSSSTALRGESLSGVVGMVDLDGDGISEGALGGEDEVMLLVGPIPLGESLEIEDSSLFLSSSGGFGRAISTGAALLVGAPEASAAYLYTDLSGSPALSLSAAADARAGTSVALVGDNDGDGVEDLLIGGPGGEDGGTVWWLSGTARGSVALADADREIIAGRSANLGSVVGGGADLDGDGAADLIVGSSDWGGGGSIFVLPANSESGKISALVTGRIDGVEGDTIGTTLPAVGDFDGDAYADLAVGTASVTNLIYGPWSGAYGYDLSISLGAAHAGAPTLGLEDINHDGKDDLLIATDVRSSGVSSEECIYLFHGQGL